MPDICRVCLSGYRRMYAVNKTVLQEIWERLTKVEFNIDDGKPHMVCYICYAHLKNAHKLMKRASRAEESLTILINDGLVLSQKTMPMLSNMAHELDYDYVTKQLNCDEYKEFEGVEDTEKKNEGESKEGDEFIVIQVKVEKEDKEYENDIQIKQESDINAGEHNIYFKEEDFPESTHTGSKKDDVKTEFYSDSNDQLRTLNPENILGNVEVVLEEVDQVFSTRKRKLNEAPQNAKLLKLEDAIEDGKSCAAGPSTSFDRSNEGNKTTISNNKNTGENRYICDLCDYGCFRKHNLITHIKCKHTMERKFSCQICQYKCVTSNKLTIHLRKHSGEKPYVCELCDYRCSQQNNLKDHIRYKHTKEKKFSCHICQNKFVTNNALIVHLRKHTGEKPYVCELCDYRSSQKVNLKFHIQRKHTKDKNFSCHICQYKCVTNDMLTIHLRKHTGEKPYACVLCDYRCSQKNNLKDHIRYKHTEEKNFSCHMCQYKCVTKGALNKHLQTHTGEKPYVCELCDFRCSQKNNLNEHIRYKHTKEKNFSCYICQYKFVTKGDLNRHLRTHTGDK